MAAYSAIKTTVKAFLQDDYADFDGQIDEAVINAEKRLSRDLNLPDQFTWKTNGTLTQGTATLALPAGATGVIHWLSITPSSGKQSILQRRTTSFIRDYAPAPATTGEPKYYGIYDDATLLLGPTPNYQTGTTDYPYTLVYEVRIGTLTATEATTTWFSTNAEDLLIYAILVEGAMFHKAMAKAGSEGSREFYEKEYERRLESQRTEVARIMRDQASSTH